ncbi:Quinolinate synthase [Citrus sinensis]|uniref:Quinolinate synthase n=1 Tax=Citrus sinensis TaxID=2711 RepID=A0ACB8LTS8_CITSI|nr:Quinolinate synthase [Citrus sinensis]
MDSAVSLTMKSASVSSSSFLAGSPFLISKNKNPNFNSKKPFFNPRRAARFFSKPLISLQSPGPTSQNPLPSSFSYSAVTETTDLLPCKLHQLISEFQSLPEQLDRLNRLLHYSTLLPHLPDSSRVDSNRVMGCTARVWLEATLDQDNKMRFRADSDSEITRGFCYCLASVFDGAAPEEVLRVKTEDLAALNVSLVGRERSRVNTWHNVFVSMQKRTKALVAERQGQKPFEPFPSLIVTKDGLQAKGSYAEAQARYLFPDESKVEELVNVLKEKKIGIVAHFYMDPEVQGVLTAAQKYWPHIYISDSLVMADTAVKMAKAGCQFITVLGVDFMSENVRAILDQAGFQDVGVYRMSGERIGCSLADAAATPAYMNYLEAASTNPPSLHVIYINTSLETKAYAHELVPTITCTSSNVVQTILQIPDLNIWYGPDSYMGANITELFQQIAMMSDEEIAEIHPKHNKDSIKSLLPRLHYYQDGTCIVHHLFGHEVVEKINEMYCDAFLTAHLEVPGEMFSLAMEAKKRGMGVVGSTKNILDFIKERVQEVLDRDVDDHLQFVLGTESGMVTSIVAAVCNLLGSAKSSGNSKINVEIVFPVSSDSMTKSSISSSSNLKSVTLGDVALPVIPGVASGEGCSTNGGCASCPYMKMNSLSSLLKVCHQLPHGKNNLKAYEAERFKSQTLQGKSIADVGCEPILHMRHFQAKKELPEKLVNQVIHPHSGNCKSMSLS